MNPPRELADLLRETAATYEYLVETCVSPRRRSVGTNLRGIAAIVEFAVRCHPGRFADGALDNPLLEIGIESVRTARPVRVSRRPGRRCVVHVATEVHPIGGHTRTILNWARSDRESSHWLYLTSQAGRAVPSWLTEALRKTGGDVLQPSKPTDLLAGAGELRGLAEEIADLVVIHHHGYDVVPVIAFARQDGPPVTILNHSDHTFWLGSSICDLVINQREASGRLSGRRFSRRDILLPIPLREPSPERMKDARQRLGIPTGDTILLAIGRATKFRPIPQQNFFRTAHRLLAACPSAHLVVVGIDADEAARGDGAFEPHSRLHLLGKVEDPSAFLATADVYLDPFPCGSATAALEAAVMGKPIVLAYAPLLDLLTTNHGLNHLLSNPPDEEQYVEEVCRLVASATARNQLGEALQLHVRSNHVGDGWQEHVHRLYEVATGLRHTPARIPVTNSEQTETDVALHKWLKWSGETTTPDRFARDLVFDAAYHARSSGCYREALSLLAGAVLRRRGGPRFLSAIAKLPIHWLGFRSASPAIRAW